MRDGAFAERLLSLFTASQNAAAIVGDLTEERQLRGSTWFWVQLIRTALAFWRRTLTDAPVAVLTLTAAGCVMLTAPAVAGFAAINLFPKLHYSPVAWVALSLFWCGGAVWTGYSLVTLSPRRGPAACLLLSATGACLVSGLFIGALTHGPVSAPDMLLCSIGLAAFALVFRTCGVLHSQALVR